LLKDDDSGEYSIEVDPRETHSQTIKQLRELGFNRISLGLQDFDPAVQKAVNRIQSEEQTFSVLEAARAEGFSLNQYRFNLRLAAANGSNLFPKLSIPYWQLHRIASRFLIMPTCRHGLKPSGRLTMPTCQAQKLTGYFTMVGQKLTEAGYVYIGMDHFAKPDDELAIAQREGKLYRIFKAIQHILIVT